MTKCLAMYVALVAILLEDRPLVPVVPLVLLQPQQDSHPALPVLQELILSLVSPLVQPSLMAQDVLTHVRLSNIALRTLAWHVHRELTVMGCMVTSVKLGLTR